MFGGPDGMRRMMSQDSLKPKNTGETLARFGSYFKPYWLIMILVAIMIVVSTWAQVENPDLIGQAVDCYLTPAAASSFGNFPGASSLSSPGTGSASASNTTSTNCWYASNTAGMTNAQRVSGLGGLILVVIGLFVASSVLTGLIFFSMSWSGNHVLRTLQVDVFEHLHRLSLSYYAEHEVGDLMSRITNDISTIQQAINFALVNVLTGVLLILWIGYNMLTLSPAYGLISLAVVPLMAFATLWFSGQARKAFRKTRTEIGNVNAELQESFSAVREAQAFNREQENIDNFRVTNAANRDANVRAVAFTSALAPTLAGLGYLAMAIVAGAGGLVLLRGQTLFGATISLGLVITYLLYVQRFNQPIQQIAVLWTNIQNAIAGSERIFGLLDIEPALQDAPDAMTMPAINGKVEFVNVSAAYKKDEHVLEGVSFSAEPGQTIAIVGITGAGKTTMINLIPRFYDVTSGAVLIDGLDVRNVTAESLRKQIGIVLQDTFLFSTTVMDNIRFGRPGASDEDVIAAAKLAYADSFIERLPDRLQDRAGRARQRPQPGSAPVDCHCPGCSGKSAHPDPGRGHLQCRYPHRAPDPESPGKAARRPHQLCHRPPPEHHPQRRSASGARPGQDHRARQAQRTARAQRLLLRSVHEPVPPRYGIRQAE